MIQYTYIVANGCTLCGTCAVECRSGAVVIGPKGARIDQDKCTRCGICLKNCASEAIQRREEGTEVSEK